MTPFALLEKSASKGAYRKLFESVKKLIAGRRESAAADDAYTRHMNRVGYVARRHRDMVPGMAEAKLKRLEELWRPLDQRLSASRRNMPRLKRVAAGRLQQALSDADDKLLQYGAPAGGGFVLGRITSDD